MAEAVMTQRGHVKGGFPAIVGQGWNFVQNEPNAGQDEAFISFILETYDKFINDDSFEYRLYDDGALFCAIMLREAGRTDLSHERIIESAVPLAESYLEKAEKKLVKKDPKKAADKAVWAAGWFADAIAEGREDLIPMLERASEITINGSAQISGKTELYEEHIVHDYERLGLEPPIQQIVKRRIEISQEPLQEYEHIRHKINASIKNGKEIEKYDANASKKLISEACRSGIALALSENGLLEDMPNVYEVEEYAIALAELGFEDEARVGRDKALWVIYKKQVEAAKHASGYEELYMWQNISRETIVHLFKAKHPEATALMETALRNQIDALFVNYFTEDIIYSDGWDYFAEKGIIDQETQDKILQYLNKKIARMMNEILACDDYNDDDIFLHIAISHINITESLTASNQLSQEELESAIQRSKACLERAKELASRISDTSVLEHVIDESAQTYRTIASLETREQSLLQ